MYLCGANHVYLRIRVEYSVADHPLLTHYYFSFMKLWGILFLVVSHLGSDYYEKAYGASQNGRVLWRFAISVPGIWGGKFRIGTQSEYLVVTLKSTGAVN